MAPGSQAAVLLTAWLIVGSAVLGLFVASPLAAIVRRVPRGEPLRLGRRGSIRASAPLMGVTAVVFALVAAWYASADAVGPGSGSAGGPAAESGVVAGAWRATAMLGPPAHAVAWWLGLAAYLWFAGAGIALVLIDLEHRRLPDRIVLPSLVAVVALLTVSSVLGGDWGRLAATLGGSAVVFAVYLWLALAARGGLGGGDLKLAPLIGAALGFAGAGALLVGVLSGFALGAAAGLVLVALRRASRTRAFPFGPCMLLGAWAGLVWGARISEACLGLTYGA